MISSVRPVSISDHHDTADDGRTVDINAAEELHIRVFQAGSRFIDERWNAADVRSAYWRLYVNDDDGASLRLRGDRLWPIPGRRVVLVPAWVRFSCECRGSPRHRYVHFDVIGLPAPLTRELVPEPFEVESPPGMLDRARDAVDHACRDDTPPRRLYLQAVVAETLALGLTQVGADDRLRHWLTGDSRVRPAVDHVERHLAGDCSTPRLAEACGMSEGHFTRLFKRELGVTPARYVLDRRLIRAAQRLAFTDDTIEAIADETGFADRFHFSRVFHRRIGSPPARFRAMGRTQRVDSRS